MTNKIYVGGKDLVSYIGAILHNLSEEGSDNEECHLISRGRSNNGKALDIAEMAKRDNEAISIEEISLTTEEFLNEDEIEDSDVDSGDVDDLTEEQYEELVNKVTSLDIRISRE